MEIVRSEFVGKEKALFLTGETDLDCLEKIAEFMDKNCQGMSLRNFEGRDFVYRIEDMHGWGLTIHLGEFLMLTDNGVTAMPPHLFFKNYKVTDWG